ncbi:MAG TPA: hypothetical protein VLC09_18020 [Polyangiaceae bacterium]|nr:hypothetical protein [Polyangiaceae bacterium]
MRTPIRLAPLALGLLFVPSPARADVSSWFSVAPGASVIDQSKAAEAAGLSSPLVWGGLLEFDTGLGTHPGRSVVFGALFHFAAHFAVGADLGGAARICTGGYASGGWGAGIDLGADYRVATYGGAAPMARVFVGAPYGLVLGFGGSYREGEVGTLSLTLGLDFARLSTHRSFWTETLPSPLVSPDAPRKPKPAGESPGDGSSDSPAGEPDGAPAPAF